MDFIKRYPLFTTFVTLFILAAIAQFVMVFIFMGGVGDAKQQLNNALNSRQNAIQLTPKPSQDNLDIAEKNYEELKRDYERKRETIAGEGVEQLREGMPNDPSELYFNLNQLIGEYLAEAQEQITVKDKEGTEIEVDKIEIEEDFTFGFATFIESGEGPDAEYIEDVWIQRQVINYLLRSLYDAEPGSILAVERESVVPLNLGNNKKNAQLPPDIFLMPENISARVPGIIDTMAFRITFTGYSEALRKFLNTLATNEYSLVVSSVEVRTAENQEQVSSSQNQASNSPDPFGALFGGGGANAAPEGVEIKVEEPVVVDNISEFTVIVELIKVKPLDTTEDNGEEGDPEQN